MTEPDTDRHSTTLKRTAETPVAHRRVRRQSNTHATQVNVGRVTVGGSAFVVAAGPCAVEPGVDLAALAIRLATDGASMLRGGVFKPRTDPAEFQGIGPAGFDLMAGARAAAGLPVVSELMTPEQIERYADRVDMIQIGSRHMANTPLLKAAGRAARPVLLKRGMAATMHEWFLAAEYILAAGNPNVILCERGIRTFETATRNTLDLSAVAVAKRETHLPVLVDPSHAAGRPDIITPLACAAVAVGADGLLLEVHPDPPAALSDGDQALTPDEFAMLCRTIAPYLQAAGRPLHTIPSLIHSPSPTSTVVG